MGIKAKISVDNSEVKKGLQDVEQQARKTGQNVSKSLSSPGAIDALDKLGDGADKAVTALDSISGAAGGASTGLTGLAGDIVNLAKNPIAALIAALGALAAVGVSVWDKMTLSAEEYSKKLDFINRKNKEAFDQQVKAEGEADNLFSRLRELNESDNTGLETIFLLDQLIEKYGDLGITIDKTTNKMLGLDEAQQRVIKLERSKTLKLAKREAKDRERTAIHDLEPVLSALGYTKAGLTPEEGVVQGEISQDYKSFKDALAQGLNVKLNENDYRWRTSTGQFGEVHRVKEAVDPEQVRLNKLWNSGGLDGKIDFLYALHDRTKVQEEQDAIEKLIESLQELQRVQGKLKKQERFGTNTAAEYQKIIKGIDSSVETARKNLNSRMDSRKELLEYKRQSQFNSAASGQKIDYLEQQKLPDAKSSLSAIDLTVKEYEKKLSKIEKALRKFAATGGTQKFKVGSPEYIKIIANYKKQIDAISAKGVEAEKKRATVLKEIFDIEKQISDLKRQEEEFYSKKGAALDAELIKTEKLLAIQKNQSLVDQEHSKIKSEVQMFLPINEFEQFLEDLQKTEDKLKSLEQFNTVFKDFGMQIPGIDGGSMKYLYEDLDKFREAITNLQKVQGSLSLEEFNKIFSSAGIDVSDNVALQEAFYKELESLKRTAPAKVAEFYKSAFNFGKFGTQQSFKDTFKNAGFDIKNDMSYLYKDVDSFKQAIEKLQAVKGQLSEDEFEKIFDDAFGIDSYKLDVGFIAEFYKQINELKKNAPHKLAEFYRVILNFDKENSEKLFKDTFKNLSKIKPDPNSNISKVKFDWDLTESFKNLEYMLEKAKRVAAVKMPEIDSGQNLTEIQKASLMEDEKVRYQIINELKAKGQKIDMKEVEILVKKQRALRTLQGSQQLNSQLKDQAFALQQQALRTNGFDKQATKNEAIRNAERTKGAALSQQEADQINKLIDLQFDLKNLNQQRFKFDEIKTNSLTQRGGFASGAVVQDSTHIQQQIQAQAQRSANLLQQINNQLRTMGLI